MIANRGQVVDERARITAAAAGLGRHVHRTQRVPEPCRVHLDGCGAPPRRPAPLELVDGQIDARAEENLEGTLHAVLANEPLEVPALAAGQREKAAIGALRVRVDGPRDQRRGSPPRAAPAARAPSPPRGRPSADGADDPARDGGSARPGGGRRERVGPGRETSSRGAERRSVHPPPTVSKPGPPCQGCGVPERAAGSQAPLRRAAARRSQGTQNAYRSDETEEVRLRTAGECPRASGTRRARRGSGRAALRSARGNASSTPRVAAARPMVRATARRRCEAPGSDRRRAPRRTVAEEQAGDVIRRSDQPRPDMRSLANPEPPYIIAISTQTRRIGQVYSPLGPRRGRGPPPARRVATQRSTDRRSPQRAIAITHSAGTTIVSSRRIAPKFCGRPEQERAAGEGDHGRQRAYGSPRRRTAAPAARRSAWPGSPGAGGAAAIGRRSRDPRAGGPFAEHAHVATAIDREQAPEERDPGGGQIEPGLRREPEGVPAPAHPVQRARSPVSRPGAPSRAASGGGDARRPAPLGPAGSRRPRRRGGRRGAAPVRGPAAAGLVEVEERPGEGLERPLRVPRRRACRERWMPELDRGRGSRA